MALDGRWKGCWGWPCSGSVPPLGFQSACRGFSFPGTAAGLGAGALHAGDERGDDQRSAASVRPEPLRLESGGRCPSPRAKKKLT